MRNGSKPDGGDPQGAPSRSDESRVRAADAPKTVRDLDAAWDSINSLGGTDRDTEWARAWNACVLAALAEIEKLGGRDPLTVKTKMEKAA